MKKLPRNLTVLDCEVYPNYTLIAFKDIERNTLVCHELTSESDFFGKEERRAIYTRMARGTTFGFNSLNYDLPIIHYALGGATAYEIFSMSEYIVKGDGNPAHKPWDVWDMYGLYRERAFDHFDLYEPSPGVRVSLKTYGARMHLEKIQDLPIAPGSILTLEEQYQLKEYCENDLDTTICLFMQVYEALDLRVRMGNYYNRDLRSSSDAQIAEIVIMSELGRHKSRNTPQEGKVYRYEVPSFIKFRTAEMQKLVDYITSIDFKVGANHAVDVRKYLSGVKIKFGRTSFKIGVGGSIRRRRRR